ncbi:5-formyltetrahydrofolate cyclo-ligase [Sphaceloma murrayae]|uniref:5-formyltetrahydrofolate cyclo-ligase n=1 Tax=Sphaceloma murrayae TaxID=2082308 RepID=A0A2K1QIF5_9PEZI|nr:5-formyltetrahydrofolate cyclo-ligase [Sphaceloma murrayae]
MANLAIPSADDRHSKQAWRKAFGLVLSGLSQDRIAAQSIEATGKLQTLPVYQNAASISLFLSMPNGEVQTASIVLHALRSGKRVYVPYIRRNPSTMDMLQLRNEEDFHSLTTDKWGIPSLSSSTVHERHNCLGYRGIDRDTALVDPAEAGLDLMLLPCVAFDEAFNRLGHGKGYYDRFLTRYFESKDKSGNAYRTPYLIGLALEEQLLRDPHRLPVEAWDHRVDAVLMGSEYRASES